MSGHPERPRRLDRVTSCARPTTMRPVLRAVQQPAEGVSDTYRSFSNYGHTPESSKEELLLSRRVRAYRYGGFRLVALATISVGPRNSTVSKVSIETRDRKHHVVIGRQWSVSLRVTGHPWEYDP